MQPLATIAACNRFSVKRIGFKQNINSLSNTNSFIFEFISIYSSYVDGTFVTSAQEYYIEFKSCKCGRGCNNFGTLYVYKSLFDSIYRMLGVTILLKIIDGRQP